jgi:arylsulfatase
MKRIFSACIIMASLIGSSCSDQKAGDAEIPPPNVIVIITDDQGYGDLGYFGNPRLVTPNLDMLASQSIRLNNFYVSPVCAPTRASLMTGRYHPRTGVYDTYNGGAIMAAEEVTLAEVLRQHGYQTGIFGKWHLGDNYPFRPMDQGFNESLVHGGGGIGQVGDVHNYFKFDSAYYNPVLMENGVPTQKIGYCTDIFAQAAIAFIRRNKDRPFFTYLSFNAPHTPLQVPDEYYRMYATMEIDTSTYRIKGYPIPEMSDADIEAAKRVYAMVSSIDDNIGLLMYELDNLNLWRNTILVFLTDNGPQQVRYTAGLRGRKGSVYEGGIKVPFLMVLPRAEANNRDLGFPSAHIDLFPTILDLCRIDIPEGLELDGRSLRPVLEERPVRWDDRSLFFHWQRGFPEPYRNIAVRKGDYKLVGHTDWQADVSDFELYDIKEDPFEQNDISRLETRVVTELKAEFDTYYERISNAPNLRPRRAIIGSEEANPVVLNRNDAKGPPGIWAQEHLYAYWAVSIIDEGPYDVEFVFHKPLPDEGDMILRVGPVQRTLNIKEAGLTRIRMEEIELHEGDYLMESWFWWKGQVFLPFYVEISKRSME